MKPFHLRHYALLVPSRPIVCLIPTKNEAWMIEASCRAALLWADEVIVADQGSVDGTAQIAASIRDVHVVHNALPTFDEGHRQTLLLDAARERHGTGAILAALDADELLTANAAGTREWQQFCQSAEGTYARVPHANLSSDFQRAWTPNWAQIMLLIDDGRQHSGRRIHTPRLPADLGRQPVIFREIRALHYQYVDPMRQRSKHRWYECWEREAHPARSNWSIYRQYHHMNVVSKRSLYTVPDEWFRGYEQAGLAVREAPRLPAFWWDDEVLRMVSDHPERFRGLDIWDEKSAWDPNDTVAFRPGRMNRLALRLFHAVQPIVGALQARRRPRYGAARNGST